MSWLDDLVRRKESVEKLAEDQAVALRVVIDNYRDELNKEYEYLRPTITRLLTDIERDLGLEIAPPNGEKVTDGSLSCSYSDSKDRRKLVTSYSTRDWGYRRQYGSFVWRISGPGRWNGGRPPRETAIGWGHIKHVKLVLTLITCSEETRGKSKVLSRPTTRNASALFVIGEGWDGAALRNYEYTLPGALTISDSGACRLYWRSSHSDAIPDRPYADLRFQAEIETEIKGDFNSAIKTLLAQVLSLYSFQ